MPQSGHAPGPKPRRDTRHALHSALLPPSPGTGRLRRSAASATGVRQPDPGPNPGAASCSQMGIASWYRGASRDRRSPRDLVAAHRSLPFGTEVQVTAIETVPVRCVVRIGTIAACWPGPDHRTRRGWGSLTNSDMRHDGVARVRIEPAGLKPMAARSCRHHPTSGEACGRRNHASAVPQRRTEIPFAKFRECRRPRRQASKRPNEFITSARPRATRVSSTKAGSRFDCLQCAPRTPVRASARCCRSVG